MKTTLKIFSLLTFFSLLTANGFSQVQNSSCPTDINADGITSSGDLSLLAAQFGISCVPGQPCPTDVNHDGITNITDHNLVRSKIGKRCNVGIFDVSHATYGAGYVDVPVSISSDDVIVAIDFATKINESKLTYHSINKLVTLSFFDPLAHFSPNTHFLLLTSNTLQQFPNDVALLSVRFTIAAGETITTSDLNSITFYLNGNPKGFIVK